MYFRGKEKESYRTDEGVLEAPVPFFPQRRLAERLRADNPTHIDRVIDIFGNGGTAVLPFKGVYGVFASADVVKAAEQIVMAKLRPQDKKLILTPLPEHIEEVADLRQSNINRENLVEALRVIHALGVILHAATTAPYHLVQKRDDGASTILCIVAECPPIRGTIEGLRRLGGGRALVGTSANKSGEATHWQYESVYEDFKYDVDAIMEAAPDPDFRDLPERRRMSTSIVDLTGIVPRLHRVGNTTGFEINRCLTKHGFPMMVTGRDFITVRARKYPSEGQVIAV